MKIEKIVFVSSDGAQLDEHFGQGTKFWFYQLENCDAVVTQKIGNVAKHILAEYEIYPLEYGGTTRSAIEKLLNYILKNN